MKSEVITVLTTPTKVIQADGNASYPMAGLILNSSAETIYYGGADVTTVNGFPNTVGSIPLSLDTINEDLYAVSASGTAVVNVLRRGD